MLESLREDFTRIATRSSHKDLYKIMQGPLRGLHQDLFKIFKDLYKTMVKIFIM